MERNEKIRRLADWVVAEGLPMRAAAAPYSAEIADAPYDPIDVPHLIAQAFIDGVVFRDAVATAGKVR